MRPQGNFFFLESRTTNLLWLGLLGLVVIFFFMLVFEAVAIENRLGEQVSQQIRDSGFTRAEVVVSGRDVSLIGAVSSHEAKQRLVRIAKGIKGVRVVDANLEIEPLRLSHIRLRRDQTEWLEVSGELSSPGALALLRQQIQFRVEDEESEVFTVVYDSEVTESPWLVMIGEMMEVAADIQNLFIEAGAYRLVIGGTVDSESKYRSTIAAVQSLAEQYKLEVVNRLATINRLD